MGSKALLVLVMFLASVVLLFAAEVPPKDVDQKFDPNDDNLDTNGVEDMKQRYWGGGGPYGGHYGGGWGGGWRGGRCRFGCCSWGYGGGRYGGGWGGGGWGGYGGGCRRCCYYPGEHLDIAANAEPQN